MFGPTALGWSAASGRDPRRASLASELGERAWRARQSNPGSRGAVLRTRESTRFSSASDDEVGCFRARSAPSELGERDNQIQCPRWDSNPCWSGFKPLASAIWATGASDPTAGAILTVECVQREGSTVAVAEAPPSLIRVSNGSLPRSPVAMRSSITTFAFGRKCTGCTPVIRPVALSRK
jgi:hypothetical protein